MINLKDLFFKHLSNKNYSLICIPGSKNIETDIVEGFYELLIKKLTLYNYKVIRMEKNKFKCYNELFFDENKPSIPNSVVLFAHPIKTFTGFKVNPVRKDSRNIISLEWWKTNEPFKFIYAHVCNSHNIFTRKQWKKIFPNWIAYGEEIKAYLISDTGIKRWKYVLKNILKEILQQSSLSNLRFKIQNIYLDAIYETDKTYEVKSGDPLNLMYFQECHDSIITSED